MDTKTIIKALRICGQLGGCVGKGCPYEAIECPDCAAALMLDAAKALDTFGQIPTVPPTNFSRVTASPEALAGALMDGGTDTFSQRFCRELPRCDEALERGEIIPDEWCRACLVEWLKEEEKQDG